MAANDESARAVEGANVDRGGFSLPTVLTFGDVLEDDPMNLNGKFTDFSIDSSDERTWGAEGANEDEVKTPRVEIVVSLGRATDDVPLEPLMLKLGCPGKVALKVSSSSESICSRVCSLLLNSGSLSCDPAPSSSNVSDLSASCSCEN